MKRFLLGLLFAAAAAFGQVPTPQPPDCLRQFAFTGPGVTANLMNLIAGGSNNCTYWQFSYAVASSGTVSSLQITVQSAPAGTDTSTPGSFVTYAGTAVSGAANNTSITGAQAFLSNAAVDIPWIRVNLVALSATGTTVVYGVLQGWNAGNAGGAAAGGGGCPNPCPVEGTSAAGMPPVGPPVQGGGFDGTNIQPLALDTAGRTKVVGPAAAGTALAGAPLLPGFSDGTNVQNQFWCPNQATVTISAGTDVVLVAGVASTTIRICHIDFASDTVATFTIRQGTGTTCLTNTATLAGPYPSILNFAGDYLAQGALRTTIAARDLCLHASTSSTVGGAITYAQF